MAVPASQASKSAARQVTAPSLLSSCHSMTNWHLRHGENQRIIAAQLACQRIDAGSVTLPWGPPASRRSIRRQQRSVSSVKSPGTQQHFPIFRAGQVVRFHGRCASPHPAARCVPFQCACEAGAVVLASAPASRAVAPPTLSVCLPRRQRNRGPVWAAAGLRRAGWNTACTISCCVADSMRRARLRASRAYDRVAARDTEDGVPPRRSKQLNPLRRYPPPFSSSRSPRRSAADLSTLCRSSPSR